MTVAIVGKIKAPTSTLVYETGGLSSATSVLAIHELVSVNINYLYILSYICHCEYHINIHDMDYEYAQGAMKTGCTLTPMAQIQHMQNSSVLVNCECISSAAVFCTHKVQKLTLNLKSLARNNTLITHMSLYSVLTKEIFSKVVASRVVTKGGKTKPNDTNLCSWALPSLPWRQQMRQQPSLRRQANVTWRDLTISHSMKWYTFISAVH